jgi:PilZ domain-containing protein
MEERNRRRHERFAVSLPIATDRGKGFTCEMSVAALSFEIDCQYSDGDPIAMTITFLGNRELEAHCSGRVLRATRAKSGWHIAATIDRFTFSRSSPF